MSPLTFQVYLKETCTAPSLLREERDTEDAERIANCIRVHSSVLFSYFEKKIAHMSVVWAYVSLWLCLFGCVLQGPIIKVEGTKLGTKKILASKHRIAAPKVKQRQFETAIVVLHTFVVFYYG